MASTLMLLGRTQRTCVFAVRALETQIVVITQGSFQILRNPILSRQQAWAIEGIFPEYYATVVGAADKLRYTIRPPLGLRILYA